MSALATIDVRRLTHDDVDDAARLLFDSFSAVYRQRGHTPPFPNVESAAWLCRAYLDLDPEGCALARTGRLPAGASGSRIAAGRSPASGRSPRARAVREGSDGR